MTQHEFNTIVQSGEGYKIEFKRNVNTDLSKELVAFANASGGRIFLGIEDDGKIHGLTINNTLKSEVQIKARNCDPSIPVEVETFENILIVHVPEGKNKPYRNANGFYIRNGASSVKLTTEEIREFFKEEGKVHFDEMLSKAAFPDEVSDGVVKNYMIVSGISSITSTRELFINLGIINNDDPFLNNAGALFFTNNPLQYIPQSEVICVAYKGPSKVNIIDKKSFGFDLITNIELTITFIKRHLNITYEIKKTRRNESLEIPEVALRESVVNAVAHRDYFQKGANVMIEIFDNRVEITNPGGLPKGLKPEDFGKRTLARNPLIAALLNRAGYIEKLGSGVPRIRQSMADAELPEPDFNFDSFFTVILRRYNFKDVLKKELKLNDKRSERMTFILRQLAASGSFNVEEAAIKMLTTSRTVRNDLELLIRKGWITSSGTTKGRDYKLTDIGKEKHGRYE